jgi:hypothetical protein
MTSGPKSRVPLGIETEIFDIALQS